MDALRPVLEECGQAHLLEGWTELSPEQQAAFVQQLQSVDWPYVRHIFQGSMAGADQKAKPAEPVNNVATLAGSTDAQRTAWREAGLRLVAQGALGVLLLAGGQGTRLGSSAPKGCYDIGLPSRKSLFQLQAERLLRLQALAAPYAPDGAARPLRWYIMTSPATDAETRRHFVDNSYFGLRPDQVFFFQQGVLPAMTLEGAAILEAPGRLALSPDGNGGVYVALRSAGVLDDMAAQGVTRLDVYCVDNALVRPGDPVFAGFCELGGVDCGAKVVAKAYPEEKVGVFALRGGALEVVEYSELDPAEAAAAGPATGQLRYNWSNICLHSFSVEWLRRVADALAAAGRYHVAHKKIPSKDGPVQGVKLELFIFDTFPLASKTGLLEVARAEEFAPVKNAPGSAADTPEAARDAILSLHASWVRAAGGVVELEAPGAGVEVSPLVSYAGEGLDALAGGKTFRAAFDVHLQGVVSHSSRALLGRADSAGDKYNSPRPEALRKPSALGGRPGVHIVAASGLGR